MPYLHFMVIVTGAAGFIGSQIANHVSKSAKALTLVDKLPLLKQSPYLKDLTAANLLDADVFLSNLASLEKVDAVIHMGAITNTAEKDQAALDYWNVNYTKAVWRFCVKNKVPLVYASSAATYGDGNQGFSDDHQAIPKLKPLNLYGKSKHQFDLFALEQTATPDYWYGLKFFNVYGPHEDHKGRMASSVWHGFNEIKKTGQMTLFRSHNSHFKDGEQARDFIFVKDVLKVIDFLLSKKPQNGIYNCGTGIATSFGTLADKLFLATRNEKKIHWVDTPPEFRDAYQYKTQADMTKLKSVGFKETFTQVSEGVDEYVTYLQK